MSIIKRGLRFFWRRAKKVVYFLPSSWAYHKLKKIQEEVENSALFITSYALGDVIYAMAYLKIWRAQNSGKTVVLIADPKKREVIESYSDYDKVIYYERSTSMGKGVLVHLNGSRFYSFLGRKRGIYNTIPQQIYGGRTGRDNLDLMKEYFQIPINSEVTYPHPQKVQIKSISDFESNKDRIVIINPYSGGRTICECVDLLNRIADVLKRRGYIVFSNIVGDQEPLEGTYPLRCGLLELYSIVDMIPMMVSVRSGIMDWLISTRAKKFVVYNAKIKKGFELFALSAWGECNCKEVHMAQMNDEEIMGAFEEYLGG